MEAQTTVELGNEITNFLREKFPLARKRNINENTPLLESGIVDSMGILDLVAFLEQRYSVAVGDDELIPENFNNISVLTTFVEQKLRDR